MYHSRQISQNNLTSTVVVESSEHREAAAAARGAAVPMGTRVYRRDARQDERGARRRTPAGRHQLPWGEEHNTMDMNFLT